jgi:LysM repeat protein
MAHRSPARILAPLALVGAVVATIVVIQASTGGSGDSSGGSTSTATATRTGDRRGAETDARTTTTEEPRRQRRMYTVKPGDILSTVSEETGVSVDRLQELNPDLDPQALQVGQKIKLTPDTP